MKHIALITLLLLFGCTPEKPIQHPKLNIVKYSDCVFAVKITRAGKENQVTLSVSELIDLYSFENLKFRDVKEIIRSINELIEQCKKEN